MPRLSHKDLQALAAKGIDAGLPMPKKPKAKSKRKGKETPLVAACLAVLKVRGVFAWRNNTTGVYDPSKRCFRKNKGQLNGVSDILGVLRDGRFLAVECKIRPNKPTDDQERFLENVNRNGGLGIVAYSVDDLRVIWGEP